MKSNSFKEYIQPTVVLVAICLVITFALAYVNSITAPIIAIKCVSALPGSFTWNLCCFVSASFVVSDVCV